MTMSTTDQAVFKVKIADHIKDLQKLVSRTEDDLRERCGELPEVDGKLRAEWRQARDSDRTLDTFESWRDEYLTQVAVAWVLTSVFLRYLEDNALVSDVWLAGPGDRRQRANDHRRHYFQQNPTHTDREYLEEAFRTVARLPGCEELFGEKRNPLWLLGPSGDLAREMVDFWQEIDPETGELKRVFGDPDAETVADTRFLGDLYQDLSEAARKRYALLQTPDFVEEFILDYTLEPAIETFGLDEVRLLDPTCGSGHFLLGAFARILNKRHKARPGEGERDRVRKALDAVYGVDLNPFAVAIARFRLLVAALNASGIRRLKDAPNYHVNVACGDSLLHGVRRGDQRLLSAEEEWLPDLYAIGDYAEATRILSKRYHAVVGNPPYIADKDRAHKEMVRKRYSSCYGKFVLAVPFKEMFFDIAVDGQIPGFVGMITANNFMKREFGSKVIEDFLSKIDLTHVIDTSGAYIPGHGTPTVILFGRNRDWHLPVVKAALGIRGEPSTPDDPGRGKVWRSIVENLDREQAENDFITIASIEREKFHKHPWSLAGGGASELKELIERQASKVLGNCSDSIGITSFTLEDDVFLLPRAAAERKGIPSRHVRPMVTGDAVRDWSIGELEVAVFPYDEEFEPIPAVASDSVFRYLAPYRTNLSNNKMFGAKTKVEAGLTWYEYGRLTSDKLKTPLSITFAFVATHNHFVLDRGGKVFNRSAPVIKLPEGASVDEHLELLGLLNSSVACFWLKQVSNGKHKGDGGTAHASPEYQRFEFDGTKLSRFPCVSLSDYALSLSRQLDELGEQYSKPIFQGVPSARDVDDAREARHKILRRMVALQEELDWEVYRLYGIIPASDTEHFDLERLSLSLGCRPFEVKLAREIERGDSSSNWFERHNSEPMTELPADLPEAYRRVLTNRLVTIESNRFVRYLETPVFKRRWDVGRFEEKVQTELLSWLLTRLESELSGSDSSLTTTARLAERLARDEDFLQVARLYTGREDVDLTRLVTDLVMSEDVPYLSALRYNAKGLRKRAQWEKTWDLQRKEDAGEKIGKIPVPPKYGSGDFQKPHYWRLRGKLDVPKERFISYPLAERTADPSPVVGWAGWNHLDQAKALATYYLQRKEQDGWTTDQLTPLLAGLQELLPWLKQWHNDIDPDLDQRLGDFYEGFLDQELRHHHLTPKDLTDWRPPSKSKKR